MDDNVREVQQHPTALGAALTVTQIVAFGLERFLELFGQRLELEWRLRRGNDKVVSEGHAARDVEQRDIQGLAVGEYIDGLVGQRFGIQIDAPFPRVRVGRNRSTVPSQRVVVGMSGGVDSSVAAALLVEQGYDVVGVTMRLWTEERPDELKGHQQCCSVEDIDDARRVAGQLGIRHYIMNFEDEFREKVVDNFVAEYSAGRTPNPCVRCNEHIKYRALLERLPALDADFVATGHYARVAPPDPCHESDYRLLRAIDASKDQSYVLYMLNQEQLRRLLLPIGWLTKSQVRDHARRIGLDTANKPDSVEICFVPGNDYRAFVEERNALSPGEMHDDTGAVVGEHRGVAAYTLGQRKGLGIALGTPRYVTAIDASANIVTIGPEEDLFADTAVIEEVRWVSGDSPPPGARIEAKARYKAEPAAAVLIASRDDTATIRFERRQRALTPGQAVAFYDGEQVLGGGTILRAHRSQ